MSGRIVQIAVASSSARASASDPADRDGEFHSAYVEETTVVVALDVDRRVWVNFLGDKPEWRPLPPLPTTGAHKWERQRDISGAPSSDLTMWGCVLCGLEVDTPSGRLPPDEYKDGACPRMKW